MADNDFNIIKPVEGLQNIAGLTPTKHREQRKRRQNLHKKKKEKSKQELNESVNKQDIDNELLDNELTENDNDQHTIDYRAWLDNSDRPKKAKGWDNKWKKQQDTF